MTQVDRKPVIPIVFRDLAPVMPVVMRGIVDERLQPAKLCGGVVNRGFQRIGIAKIELAKPGLWPSAFTDYLLRCFLIDIDKSDLRALCGEKPDE